MLEGSFEFDGARVTRLARKAGPAPEAVVLFPGFPGYPVEAGALQGPPKLRVAVAKALLGALDVDVFLPGYAGLDDPGRFSFKRTRASGAAFARTLAKRGYGRVHVGGHSWGAFVAFHAHRDLGPAAGRLILLSGVLDLPNTAWVRAFLPYYLAHFPQVLGTGPAAFVRAAADLDAARRGRNPLTLAAPTGEDALLIVHGRLDAEVDIGVSRRFHARAGGRLALLDADHGYSGRLSELAETVLGFMLGPGASLSPRPHSRQDGALLR